MTKKEGFPALTDQGVEVRIVHKSLSGEHETFFDSDGNEYERNKLGGAGKLTLVKENSVTLIGFPSEDEPVEGNENSGDGVEGVPPLEEDGLGPEDDDFAFAFEMTEDGDIVAIESDIPFEGDDDTPEPAAA